MKPLSRALLREGKTQAVAVIAGWSVEATRLYNSPGCTGPAWNPYYRVGTYPEGTSGPRDHCERWLFNNQVATPAADNPMQVA